MNVLSPAWPICDAVTWPTSNVVTSSTSDVASCSLQALAGTQAKEPASKTARVELVTISYP